MYYKKKKLEQEEKEKMNVMKKIEEKVYHKNLLRNV